MGHSGQTSEWQLVFFAAKTMELHTSEKVFEKHCILLAQLAESVFVDHQVPPLTARPTGL